MLDLSEVVYRNRYLVVYGLDYVRVYCDVKNWVINYLIIFLESLRGECVDCEEEDDYWVYDFV